MKPSHLAPTYGCLLAIVFLVIAVVAVSTALLI